MPRSILNSNVREQIALAVSVVAKCQPCFQHHLAAAKKLGIGDREIEEVIKLARQIRAVADEKMDEHVVGALGADREDADPGTTSEGCCQSSETAKQDHNETAGCCDSSP